MRPAHVLLVLLAAGPGLLASAQLPKTVDDGDPGPRTGERVFTLVMEGTEFNGLSWPNTPLLEAYAGETMRFVVHTPADAEPHTFHMHGHPWFDEDRGFIDAILLNPGETHTFNVTAGLDRGYAGDWFYHCHMDTHFEDGMWGLLRVYPYALEAAGPVQDITLEARGPDGAPLPVTDVTARFQGEAVDAALQEAAPGAYHVELDLPDDAAGRLVLETENAEGASLLRLDVAADGSLTPVRDVGPDVETPATAGPVDGATDAKSGTETTATTP